MLELVSLPNLTVILNGSSPYESITISQNSTLILELNNPILAFAFAILFINILSKLAFKILLVDTTFNTNQLKYKLYIIIAMIDITGFLVEKIKTFE